MTGLKALGEAEVLEPGVLAEVVKREDVVCAMEVEAVVPPGGDDGVCVACGVGNPAVVAGADGVWMGDEIVGVCRAKGEEVDDVEGAESPAKREVDAATDGGVVAAMVGRAGVEEDHGEQGKTIVPAAGQEIAVAARAIEDRAAADLDGRLGVERSCHGIIPLRRGRRRGCRR